MAPTMMRPRRHVIISAGFTLIELVVVLVIVSILAVMVAVSVPTNAEATLSDQANLLARHLRHAQTLAMTWDRPLRFTPAGGTYSVYCVTAGSAPCTSTVIPVTDPATGQPFTTTLDFGASVAGATVDFGTRGQPSAARTYTLSAAGATNRTVTVSALTGFVTVSP
jgi:prepilin-type N-terminal cleavage/methylation domain-containing protein